MYFDEEMQVVDFLIANGLVQTLTFDTLKEVEHILLVDVFDSKKIDEVIQTNKQTKE